MDWIPKPAQELIDEPAHEPDRVSLKLKETAQLRPTTTQLGKIQMRKHETKQAKKASISGFLLDIFTLLFKWIGRNVLGWCLGCVRMT